MDATLHRYATVAKPQQDDMKAGATLSVDSPHTF